MEIKYRHNIMEVNSVSAFARIKGGFHDGCRDVYFVRLLGGNPSLQKETADTEQMLFESMEAGRLFYRRVKKLPYHMEKEEETYYSQCYENWVSDGKKEIVTRITEKNGEFRAVFSKAMVSVCGEYAKHKKGISHSIEKNFVMKIAWWADCLFKQWQTEWEVRSCIKIIAENISKEQEYLFYYFLTQIGADVLLMQTKADVTLPETLAVLSKTVKAGEFVEWDLPEPVCPAKNPVRNTTGNSGKSTAGNSREVSTGNSGKNTTGNSREVSTGNSGEKKARNVVKIPPRNSSRKPVACSLTGSGSNVSSRSDAERRPVLVVESAHSGTERREKSFEELASLASSVVMVAIHRSDGEMIGSGSGIMIGKDGYILTNNHVIRDGKYFSVRIEEEEKEYPTDEIIKYNPVLDLAVIRIDRKLLPIPVFDGRSPLVRGQKVVAIGSPLGLFNSVSDGIISGFRTINKVDMIQFTAPISHGSSGGAVLNMYGEVIGISTAGFDHAQNINLAVPHDQIRMFVKGFQ